MNIPRITHDRILSEYSTHPTHLFTTNGATPIMAHTHLMYLEMDSLIIEPNYTDALDDKPYVFEFHGTDNPMDADDPETAVRQYYNQVRSY